MGHSCKRAQFRCQRLLGFDQRDAGIIGQPSSFLGREMQSGREFNPPAARQHVRVSAGGPVDGLVGLPARMQLRSGLLAPTRMRAWPKLGSICQHNVSPYVRAEGRLPEGQSRAWQCRFVDEGANPK